MSKNLIKAAAFRKYGNFYLFSYLVRQRSKILVDNEGRFQRIEASTLVGLAGDEMARKLRILLESGGMYYFLFLFFLLFVFLFYFYLFSFYFIYYFSFSIYSRTIIVRLYSRLINSFFYRCGKGAPGK